MIVRLYDVDIPKDQWIVVLREDFVRQSYDMYLLKYTDEGRVAYDGERFHNVPEATETPRWLQVTQEALEDTGFLNAFKHVYVLRTVLEDYND